MVQQSHLNLYHQQQNNSNNPGVASSMTIPQKQVVSIFTKTKQANKIAQKNHNKLNLNGVNASSSKALVGVIG